MGRGSAGWGCSRRVFRRAEQRIDPDSYRRAKALPQYMKALAGWGIDPDAHRRAEALPQYRRVETLPQCMKALTGWGIVSGAYFGGLKPCLSA